jgi:hypothetical protein
MVKRTRRSVPETLTLEQVIYILEKVDFEEAVLVGGQAVLLYAQTYKLGNNIELGVSGDIDLIAKATVASKLAALIKNSQLTVATLDSNTFNTAVLAVDLNDQLFIQVDFLSAIAGLDTHKVESRTEKIRIGDNFKCRVINPLDLLTSKLHNLANIPSKRDEQGRNQAKLSIDIAHHYLKSIVAHSEMLGLKAVEAHFSNCCTEAYVVADVEYGLDAFALIEKLGIVHENFNSERFPQMHAFYLKQKSKRIALLKRREALANRQQKPV